MIVTYAIQNNSQKKKMHPRIPPSGQFPSQNPKIKTYTPTNFQIWSKFFIFALSLGDYKDNHKLGMKQQIRNKSEVQRRYDF